MGMRRKKGKGDDKGPGLGNYMGGIAISWGWNVEEQI